MMFDPLYFIILMPGFLFSMVAAWMVKSTFQHYSKVPTSSGMTGAQAAKQMLQRSGVYSVQIEETSGFLSDHYDPRGKVLRLSPDVYRGRSLSAVGVACHEAGHALQDAEAYAPLKLRSQLVPVTQFCSNAYMWVLLVGVIFQSMGLVKIGLALFAVMFIFTVVTLPVEWDASARAKRTLTTSGIVSPDEVSGAGRVLNAAFLTYVASAVTALLTLIYWLIRSGIIGGRRD